MKICPRCKEVYPDDSSFCPFDGKPLEKSKDKWIGRVLDNRYRITEKLGEGGMGKVYKAVQAHPRRYVAIKLISSKALKKKSTRKRFKREGMAASMIQHEHIVDIYSEGETEEGIPYLVMEFLDGRSLQTVLEKGPIPIDRTIQIMTHICAALGPTHALGIIHRDLKPGNIFLLPAGDGSDFVKLVDFGIAFFSKESRITAFGIAVGTPEYMAPEVVLCRPVTASADLYALGCVAYEMLSGYPPFFHEEASKVMTMQIDKDPPSLHERVRGIPDELEKIVMQLLEKEPENRFKDAYIVLHRLASLGGSTDTGTGLHESMRAKKERIPSVMGGSSAMWKEYVVGAKTTQGIVKKDNDSLERMEGLLKELEDIELQQTALSVTIETTEQESGKVKTRLRHALDVLAGSLSEKNYQLSTVQTEIKDLNFQITEIKGRMEGVDQKLAGELSVTKDDLHKLELKKLKIKDDLAGLTTTSRSKLSLKDFNTDR